MSRAKVSGVKPSGKVGRAREARPWTAMYIRISNRGGRGALQGAALQRWTELKGWAEGRTEEVRWYHDSWSGAGRRAAAWTRLMKDVEAGRVKTLVCWRLDRLAMTCSELVKLFDQLANRKVNLISLKDGLDLSTPAGRRMAGLLASVAVYESEVRAGRIVEGQEAARARGVRWGGSVKGRRLRVTPEREAKVRGLRAQGAGVTRIARETGLSRPTIYRILSEPAEGAATTPDPAAEAQMKP